MGKRRSRDSKHFCFKLSLRYIQNINEDHSGKKQQGVFTKKQKSKACS